METILTYICENAEYAPIILCTLILLAGLNIPISLDFTLLIGGIIASTCIPEHALFLYLCMLFACVLAAWEAYWIGRLLGPKLFTIHWFNKIITQERLKKLTYYLNKFGIFTFLVGRFVPGGVRNAIFMSSGLTKMPFSTFILKDAPCCLIATATIFYIGYYFGENRTVILHYFKNYEKIMLSVLIFIVIFVSFIIWRRKKSHTQENSD